MVEKTKKGYVEVRAAKSVGKAAKSGGKAAKAGDAEKATKPASASADPRVAAFQKRLASLVPAMWEAEKQGELASGNEESLEDTLGPPAKEKQILALEKRLKKTLPPSYRAFLLSYGSWPLVPFCGGADLLGVDDHADEFVEETLADKFGLFAEFSPVNPIEAGAIPLILGDDRNLVLLEPPAKKNGEMAVVEYYLTEEQGRHTDVVALFEHHLKEMLADLEKAKKKKKKR